jgi:carboxyl-terminal processing protease
LIRAPRASAFIPGLLIGLAVGLLLAVIDVFPFLEDDETLSEEAQRVIEDSYFRDPDSRALGDASVEGMVEVLRRRYDDRFSHYFDPETLEEFEAATSGRFSGVGMSVSEVKQGLRVVAVYPETPAEAAGIKEEDLIVAVDGKSLAGMGANAAAARIKGPKGSEVVLSVKTGNRAPRKIALKRAEVRIPAVEAEIREVGPHRIAYVLLSSFSEGAHEELRSELERLDRRGAEGLVLDLRGNGGGLLNEAVLTSSVFVENGVVVATEGRTHPRREYRAVGDALSPRPTAVLIDRDTASAAEILAASLSDHGLAELIGTRTFGKGTFQEVIELENGGAIDLTVGEFVTAEGRSLARRGISPDVRIPDDDDPTPDEALREALDRVAEEL